MRIAYCDESGDDGYPAYSSPLFVLSTTYIHYLSRQDAFQRIVDFRQQKIDFDFPVTRMSQEVPLDKNPYRIWLVEGRSP